MFRTYTLSKNDTKKEKTFGNIKIPYLAELYWFKTNYTVLSFQSQNK